MLEGLRVPTLLLTGGADMYTPPAALQLFVARIPGATSVVLPDVGHSAYWEQPEAFNRVVLDFVRRDDPRRQARAAAARSAAGCDRR